MAGPPYAAIGPRRSSLVNKLPLGACFGLDGKVVEGVLTRKVKEITEELCGTTFSKSLVPSLAGGLDSELEAWRNRRLEAKAYPYLFVTPAARRCGWMGGW
jgi:hypothetical protein